MDATAGAKVAVMKRSRRSQSSTGWPSFLSRKKTPPDTKDTSLPVPSKITASAPPTLRKANTVDFNRNTVVIRPSRRSPRRQDRFFSRRSLQTVKELFDNLNGNNTIDNNTINRGARISRKHPVNGDLVCPNHFDQAGYANPVQHPPGPVNHWWTERDDDEKTQDFFAMLERMQGQRLEDQRCAMPHLPSSTGPEKTTLIASNRSSVVDSD
uniref:Uncharacterized protein n=1 Tax=Plectus sambesii TaxID=2011161 RepID=A0A914V293_9BILA